MNSPANANGLDVKRSALVRMSCTVTGAALAAASCGFLGYSNRVLLRVPSPDGRLVAVCQEVPEFDGPGFDIRLERPDGTRVRQLMKQAENGGCDEIVWSPDGALLAVLKSQLVHIAVVEIPFAMENLTDNLYRSGGLRAMRLGYQEDARGSDRAARRVGQNLQFVSNIEIVYDSCAWADRDVEYFRQTKRYRCAGPVERRTVVLQLEEPVRIIEGIREPPRQ